MNKFEDLVVWQKSFQLSVVIFKIFETCKNYGLRDQITRSSLSIPSNIAEGYERDSNKEFIRFLYIAKGSCGELRTQLHVAVEIKVLSKDRGRELIEDTKEIAYMLSSLIKKRKTF